MAKVPNYLQEYSEAYRADPREAALQWLREAKYGLFLHYGLYSLLGRHEWVQFREQIRVSDYAALQQSFTASGFDAEAIAGLAADAEMRYITITTKHHDSFCLWDTAETTFNSVLAPCGRDLIGELAEACDDRGLGLCLYYSHGRDWRHPHAPNNDEYGDTARPHYDPPEPIYARGESHHLELYLEFMNNQIKELLGNYGPIAAIWLDGISTPRAGDIDAFRCQQLYDMIHNAQPQVLVSYKDGLIGTEDYFAPEAGWDFEATGDKPAEICARMHDGWGYMGGADHIGPEDVWELLGETLSSGCNLLLNTGPLPDGSIHTGDRETLLEVGERIRDEGFPG